MIDKTPPASSPMGSGDPGQPWRYVLELADLQAYSRYLAYRPRTPTRKRRLVSVSLFIAAIVLLWIFREDLWAFDVIGFFTETLLPVIVVLALLSVWGTRLQRRQAKSVGPANMTVWLGDDGLHYDDGDSDVMTRWSAVTDIIATRQHIFIAFGGTQALTIPKHMFASEQDALECVSRIQSFRPDLTPESDTETRKSRRRGWVAVAALASTLLVLIGLTWFAPWRSHVEVAGPWGSVPYMVTHTGGAQDGDTLPMIFLLHPLGGFPSITVFAARHYDFPARVVAPSGDRLHFVGRTWFPLSDDWDELTAGVRQASDRLAAFTTAITALYPTVGKPIVTGFSQGGSMTYAMAAYHPDLFSMAVPVSGALAGEVPDRAEAPGLPVRALHGEADKVMPFDWGAGSVKQLDERGYDVSMHSESVVGHAIGDTLRGRWREYLRAHAVAIRNRSD